MDRGVDDVEGDVCNLVVKGEVLVEDVDGGVHAGEGFKVCTVPEVFKLVADGGVVHSMVGGEGVPEVFCEEGLVLGAGVLGGEEEGGVMGGEGLGEGFESGVFLDEDVFGLVEDRREVAVAIGGEEMV